MSFHLSFHLASLGLTGAHCLDDPPDLSSKEITGQHAMDDPLLSCNRVLCSSSDDEHHAPSPTRAAAFGRHVTRLAT
jgi:hypothetical protein